MLDWDLDHLARSPTKCCLVGRLSKSSHSPLSWEGCQYPWKVIWGPYLPAALQSAATESKSYVHCLRLARADTAAGAGDSCLMFEFFGTGLVQ